MTALAAGMGALALAILGVGFYWPVAVLLGRALAAPAGAVLSDPFFMGVIGFTYAQAFLSALLSAVVGMPGAVFLSEPLRKKTFWNAAVLVPFSLPPVLVVLGLLGVWGRQGLVGQGLLVLGAEWDGMYGWAGILVAHVFFNFPLFVRFVGQALAEGDRAEEKAALSLGASRRECWRWVTWPKVRGAFWSAFVLAFLFSATSFLVVLVLGGGPRFTSIEVAVYSAIKQDFDLALAVKLAGVQMAVAALASVWIYRAPVLGRLQRRAAVPLYRFRSPTAQRATEVFYVAAVGFLVVLPLVWILAQGAGQWRTFLEMGTVLKVSLQLAAAAAFLALSVALALEGSARRFPNPKLRRAAWVLCTLPLTVSSLLILLGWRLAYPESVLSGGLWWAVALVQGVVALPVVSRVVREGFARLPEEPNTVARSLGASAWQRLRWVQWPLLRNTVLLGFLLGLLLALGEAGAVLLFLEESTMNLTYWIYQSMGRYRFAEAYGFATVLLFLTALLSWAVARLEKEPG